MRLRLRDVEVTKLMKTQTNENETKQAMETDAQYISKLRDIHSQRAGVVGAR